MLFNHLLLQIQFIIVLHRALPSSFAKLVYKSNLGFMATISNKLIRIINQLILLGGLEHFVPHILGIIIPTDFHIFQRGRSTTNQYN